MSARKLRFSAHGVGTAAVLAAAASAALPVWAGPDPMRPLVLPTPPGAASAPATAPPPVARPAAPGLPALPALVAIRQDSSGQRQALFGEQWVRTGDRLPGGRPVLAIDDSQVHVGGAAGARPQQIALLPVLQAADAAPPATRAAEPARPSRRPSSNPP